MSDRAWRERDHPRHPAKTGVGGQFRVRGAGPAAWARLASSRFGLRLLQAQDAMPPTDVILGQTQAERDRDRREHGLNLGQTVDPPGGRGIVTHLRSSADGDTVVGVWSPAAGVETEYLAPDPTKPSTWFPDPQISPGLRAVSGVDRWITHVSQHLGGLRHLSLPPSDEPGLLERVGYRGGFTHSFIGRADPGSGYALSPYSGRSEVIETRALSVRSLQRFREDNADLLQRPDHYIGAWRERDEAAGVDRVWLDVSIVVKDRHEAEIIGKEHNQVAMWDLGAGQEVPLGGTGE